MKNFLRALRYSWPFRGRLVLSLLCALMAAILWSLNLSAIYPVLKILSTNQSPQEWISAQAAESQKQIDELEPKVDDLSRKMHDTDDMDLGPTRDKIRRDLSRELAKLEGRLEMHRTDLRHALLAKKYIDLLPSDGFKVLVWLFGAVVVAVAIKGCFEFAQESLVGSVVNLSLFDLRNRFYRNAIHLDVDQFGEQGSSELMARFTNDVESLGAGIKTLFGKVVAEPLRALSCVLIACYINWQLTLMFLVLVPVAAFILAKVGRVMKQATRRLLERMSNIYKILQESFQGIRVVKAFTMEPHERRRFRAATRDYYQKAMMVVNIDAATSPVIEVLGVAAVALALLAGSYLVLTGETRLFA